MHRHPVSSVPSLCSLMKTLHQVYYTDDCANDALIGRELFKHVEEGLIYTEQNILASKVNNFNVLYENLVKDPVQIIKGIYKYFQWEFSKEYESILVGKLYLYI